MRQRDRNEFNHGSMKSCAGFFNITSILTGKSSASVISELKVYSDSLLLWVESVLLCPGLGMLWSAKRNKSRQPYGFPCDCVFTDIKTSCYFTAINIGKERFFYSGLSIHLKPMRCSRQSNLWRQIRSYTIKYCCRKQNQATTQHFVGMTRSVYRKHRQQFSNFPGIILGNIFGSHHIKYS